MLTGQADDLYRIQYIVNLMKQLPKSAGRRHPEKARHRLSGFVEDAMRDAHRQADQIARVGAGFLAIQNKVEMTIEHVDEFILIGMATNRRVLFHIELPERPCRNFLR